MCESLLTFVIVRCKRQQLYVTDCLNNTRIVSYYNVVVNIPGVNWILPMVRNSEHFSVDEKIH